MAMFNKELNESIRYLWGRKYIHDNKVFTIV